MSEHFSSRQKRETEQIQEAARIGEAALDIIDETYGTGYPLWTHGRPELSYHNGHHGREVGKAAFKLCTVLDLSPAERAVAETAGFAHDIVQLKGWGMDERKSAQWLESHLANTDPDLFPAHLRTMASLAIIGTEPIFNNGQLVGQKATELNYPSKNAALLAKSVAAGDLGELYTPEGPYLGHQLFREIQGMPDEEEIPFHKITAFQRNQITLLEKYRYPIEQAEKILSTHRPQVIAYSHDTLNQLENGAIDSWSELLRRDRAFIATHR